MIQNRTIARQEAKRPPPPPGEWLLRLQGEILGPIPAEEIIQRMFSGEVDESTEVSPEEGDWSTIERTPSFHPFLYEAKAKIRADMARAEALRAARKRRVRNLIKVSLGALFLIVISFVASYLLIVSRPWRSSEVMRRWATKHLPLLQVQIAKASMVAQPTAPDDEDFEDDEMDDEIVIDQILIDDAPALVAIDDKPSTKAKRKKKSKTTASSTAPAKVATLTALANEEITGAVYAKRNIRRLYGCIRREIRKGTDLPSVIRMGFTIKNNGKVGQVRMDNFKLDGSPLHRCFEQQLTKLKFRPYSGERRNVEIPFNIGK